MVSHTPRLVCCLTEAVLCCWFAVVLAVLAAHSESTTICDEDGETPLHLALYKQASPAVVEAVLQANPAAAVVECGSGQVPLYWAISNGYAQVSLGIRLDCNISISTVGRPPPVSLAMTCRILSASSRQKCLKSWQTAWYRSSRSEYRAATRPILNETDR